MGNSSDKLFWDFVKSTYISRLKKGTACIERSASRPMPNYASYALKICLLAAALKYKPASVPGGTLLAVASRSASFLSDKKRKVSSAKSRLRGVQCTTPSLISTFDLVETEKPAALCNDPTSTCIMETSLEREYKEDTQTDDRSCFKAESPCQPAIDLMKTRKEKKKEIKMKPLICTDQSQNDDTSCFKTENQNCSHQPQAEAIELSKAEIYKNIDRQRKPIADTNETDTTTYPKVQCLTSYTSIDAIQIGFENISSHQKFSFSPEAIQNEDWEYYTEQPIQNVKNSKKNTTDKCDTIAMVSIEDLKEGSESRITPAAAINDACPVSEKDINKKKTYEIKFLKVLEMAARPVVHKVPMMLEQTEKKENIESINQRWSDQDKSSKVNCPAKNDDTNLTNIKNINSGTLSSSELDMKQIKIKTNLRKRHANTDISDDPIKKVKDSNMKNSTYTDKCSSFDSHEIQQTKKTFLSGFCKRACLSWIIFLFRCYLVNLVSGHSSKCTITMKGRIQVPDLFMYPEQSGCTLNGVTRWEGGTENKILTSNGGRTPNTDERFVPVDLNGTFGLRIKNFTAEDYNCVYLYWLKFEKIRVYPPNLGIQLSKETINISCNVAANKVRINYSVMELFFELVIKVILLVNNQTRELNGTFLKQNDGTFTMEYLLKMDVCNGTLEVFYNSPEFPGIEGTLNKSGITAEECLGSKDSGSGDHTTAVVLGLVGSLIVAVVFLLCYFYREKKVCWKQASPAESNGNESAYPLTSSHKKTAQWS